MEDFPVEIIGVILSQVGDAQDLVVASLTCRKWQEARRDHVDTLAFISSDWTVYDELLINSLEEIITKTIRNTKALQCLSIIMSEHVEFSVAPVTAWLISTKDTLRQLHYNVKTPELNILEICNCHRLQVLDLAYNSITSFESSYQKFPCLTSLALTCVKISTLDLSCWLSACPNIEVLNLFALDFDTDSPEMSMRLRSNSLKDIQVEVLELRKFILEADSLEKLQLTTCTMNTFKFRGKGTLRILDLDKVVISHLDIAKNAENLEIVNVRNSPISRSKFYHMIVKLSKARRIKLHGVMSGDDNNEVVVRNTTSAHFPQLTHLSLSYELVEALQRGLLGYCQLENVVEVELRWRSISHLQSQWLVELLHRCPKLRKLIIGGAVVGVMRHEDCPILSNFTTFIINRMKDYRRVDVQFLYN